MDVVILSYQAKPGWSLVLDVTSSECGVPESSNLGTATMFEERSRAVKVTRLGSAEYPSRLTIPVAR